MTLSQATNHRQNSRPTPDYQKIASRLKDFSKTLSFQDLRITGTTLEEHPQHLKRWLQAGRHGTMSYMARNVELRTNPDLLAPGTIRILSARANYRADPGDAMALLDDGKTAYISRYALGRDYHKLIRKRLAKVAKFLQAEVPGAQTRAFADSAPILEKAVAEKAGLGWIGKNTLLLNRAAGSWFFLGEILTDAPLPIDEPETGNHCGSCEACMQACPTNAITAAGQLDARRCISYLTIENKEDIPEQFRQAVGNRIFGCDDCQLVCPWTRFAKTTDIEGFAAKSPFADGKLLDFWHWGEEEFLARVQGMALRRINYNQWRRNLAVALGNLPPSRVIYNALQSQLESASDMVKRHIRWALERHSRARSQAQEAPPGSDAMKKCSR